MNKKVVLLGLLVLVSLTLAHTVKAETGFQAQLQGLMDRLNNLRQMVGAAVNTSTLSGIGEGGGSVSGGGGGVACPALSLPMAQPGQTLRCAQTSTGAAWVATSNLMNDGQNVTITSSQWQKILSLIGTGDDQTALYAKVQSNAVPSAPAIHAENNTGLAILADGGISTDKIVVFQDSLSPLASSVFTNNVNGGFGIYQTGANTQNFFQSPIGIGTKNPQESLDLGGGNIKMGYERVVQNSLPGVAVVTVNCPSNKYVIGGGCSSNPLMGTPRAFGPTLNLASWVCNWGDSNNDVVVSAIAICANIR